LHLPKMRWEFLSVGDGWPIPCRDLALGLPRGFIGPWHSLAGRGFSLRPFSTVPSNVYPPNGESEKVQNPPPHGIHIHLFSPCQGCWKPEFPSFSLFLPFHREASPMIPPLRPESSQKRAQVISGDYGISHGSFTSCKESWHATTLLPPKRR